MVNNYPDLKDKMEFWNIKSVSGDEKVKNKVTKKIKEKVKQLYVDLKKK